MKESEEVRNKLHKFIGKNIDYYERIFFDLDSNIIFSQFNNSALVFGSIWFFYRKLFVIGSVLFLSPLILLYVTGSLFESIGSNQKGLMLIFFFYVAIRFLAGYLANRIYWKKWCYYRSFVVPPIFLKISESTNIIFPILVLFLALIWILSLLIVGIRHY